MLIRINGGNSAACGALSPANTSANRLKNSAVSAANTARLRADREGWVPSTWFEHGLALIQNVGEREFVYYHSVKRVMRANFYLFENARFPCLACFSAFFETVPFCYSERNEVKLKNFYEIL